ncbi:MAG: PDZ domain-containing protein [Steroidobacteraceae bacterium]|jgi:S1-C subfamily serine protease|nr:PDZ domain-containing protein [Steroidobacteraceae bacterium]
MSKAIVTMLATLLAFSAAPVVAQPADKQAPDEAAAAAEQRAKLEDARRRLEEAAREVAELSSEVYGPAMREVIRLRTGSPRRAMLGINLGNPEPGTRGVKVVSVSPGGPAAEAGMLAGDVIVAIDGKSVEQGRDLTTRMRDVEPGQKVALGLRRDGRDRELFVVARAADLARWTGEGGIPVPGVPPVPPLPEIGTFLLRGFADAEFATVTPGLGRYFGTDKGVLVLRVPPDAGVGLEEGDVILEIGGREPESGSHALRILRSYQPGEKVTLRIMRDRKPRDLAIEVPRAPQARAPRGEAPLAG